MKIICKLILTIIILLSFFCLCSDAMTQTNMHPRNKAIIKMYPRGAELKWPEVPRILANEAWRLFKEGKALLIDSDGKEPYQNYHVIGAIHIPGNELEKLRPEQLNSGGKTLIVYCY
jgi:hypothetical protein